MERFDLAVIGAGTAGLVTAAGAASLGAKVALIERDRTGGECLYTGCVPTKALIRAAKVAQMVRRASEFGITTHGPVQIDYAGVRGHMLRAIAQIEEHDSAERFERLGVSVIKGTATFRSPTQLEVDGQPLHAAKSVIASGSRSVAPPIPGLAETGYWSHVEAIAAEQLPASIIVLGAGPIGLEFAQLWSRLGVKVTVLERAPQILIKEDQEAAQLVQEILKAEGVQIETGVEVVRAYKNGAQKVVVGRAQHTDREYQADQLFVAAGRAPNLEELNLTSVGVEFDRQGVKVNAALRSTARNIWAAGDAVGPYLFTHVANYQGRLVVSNALLPIQRQVNYRVVPWTTFLDPEVSHLGLTEQEAKQQHGDGIKLFRYALSKLDRAITDGEGHGFVKVITDRGGTILGAHIVGPNSGDLMHELALAMQSGIKIGAISQMIHAYPTLAEGIQRTADLYWRERLFADNSVAGRMLKRVVRFFN